MVSRFAPSPTGRLHLGHVYSACLAWNRVQASGGEFLLRFEDIDHTRVREEYYAGIETDLRWLGMRWQDEPWRQLDRLAIYEEALQQLRDLGLLYPCFCTRKDLAASAPQEGDEVSKYSGQCRSLTQEVRETKLTSGVTCSWRLDMTKAAREVGSLSFVDERFGKVHVEPEVLGDPVLVRKDIATSYHLAVVIDDAAQGVSEVVRGEDLLSSTHIHRVLQELLGFPEVGYLHHRLITDEAGKRLAKRHDALALATLRERGWSRERVLAAVGL